MEEARASLLHTLESHTTLPKLECIASQQEKNPVPLGWHARPIHPNPQTARTAQWSPDGTCLLTTRADNTLETFVLPADLLAAEEPVELEAYSTLSSAEPYYATAAYPFFDLNDMATTLQLHSKQDKPIHLRNALSYDAGVYASYPFINTATEAYIAPHSLIFTPEGTHFVAGGTSMLAVFDVSRNGENPVERHRTGNRSKGLKSMANVTGPKSIISTMDISCDNFLALGTYTREIGVYSNSGRGQNITAFALNMSEPASNPEPKGCGVTQVKWSPCGRYLFIAERRSSGIGVWDIRGAGRRLAWLEGRDASTNVQCGFDVVRTGESCEVWAGTTDGKVKMWGNAGGREGVVEPDAEWDVHDDIVSATLVHQSGTVLATLSQEDRYAGFYPHSASSPDPSDSESSSSSEPSSEEESSGSEARSEPESIPGESTCSGSLSHNRRDGKLKIWSIK